jgi:hypothetical protein
MRKSTSNQERALVCLLLARQLRRLKKHRDDKESWKVCDMVELHDALDRHIDAILCGSLQRGEREKRLDHCADVANLVAMLADRALRGRG